MKKKAILSIFLTIVFYLVVLFCVDALITIIDCNIKTRWKCVIMLAVIVVSVYMCIKYKKTAVVFSSLGIVTIAVLLVGTISFSSKSKYEEVDFNKANLFSNHRVMLIVPHEDDDINVLGGITEQYVKYGSEVYVVFVTNGDSLDIGKTRINEAIECLNKCGIPEDNVIFLGYGEMALSGPHIYNAASDTVLTSAAGYTETYGTETHAAYNDGNTYTYNHCKEDMKNVILEYRPDVLYCVDYDIHIDHRAVSLLFERTMGEILQENDAYRPIVLKGFAYSTAWYAESDFYSANIISTINPYDEFMEETGYYFWGDRLRLPVDASGLSRSILSTDQYDNLKTYASQNAQKKALNVINGDKVFWERSTESFAYTAKFETSSGNGELLNDFMLFDNYNLRKEDRSASDGIWIPDKSDKEKSVVISFNEQKDISYISLYDNPSPKDNVLNARIVLDSGTVIETGPLNALGNPTVINVDETNIKTFTIVLEETEGNNAGLSEVEAFDSSTENHFNYIKLMDENGDFVYDYLMGEEADFLIYRSGDVPEVNEENYKVECDNSLCAAEIHDGYIKIICPRGEKSIVTVSDVSGEYKDSVMVSNENNSVELWQQVEKIFVRLSFYEIPGKVLKYIQQI